MKTTAILYCLVTFLTYGQNKNIVIVDSSSKKPVKYANIYYKKRKTGTFSDEKGYFKLDKKAKDTLLISVLGYKSRAIYYRDIKDTVFLNRETIKLREIVLDNTNQILTYGYHKQGGTFLGSNVKKAIIAMYIPNSNKNLRQTITSLYFKIRKKGRFISMVRPHLYSVNTFRNVPKDEVLNKNIIRTVKRSGKRILTIDITGEHIVFPKEGICVGLERIANAANIDFGFQNVKKEQKNYATITSAILKDKQWIPLLGNKKNIVNFGFSTKMINN